jgi:ribulose-phosphate 3-epimerase
MNNYYPEVKISPSLMCGELCNLEKSIRQIENNGIEMLHIDIIDGAFSPSMPLGIEVIKQLRKITDMDFDVHIMSQNNEFFINEMLKIGVQQISFHYETSLHVDRLINLIKKNNVKAGIAINPATSLSVLDYILGECEVILLMLINPGFATDRTEKQVHYSARKIADLYNFIQNKHLTTLIEVDGRVSLEGIPDLVAAGADVLVAGSTSLFIPGNTLAENKRRMLESIHQGLERRGK